MGAYRSKAQARLFHAKEARGELTHAEVVRRDKATDFRGLPEHVKAHKRATAQMAKEGIAMREHARGRHR